MYEYGLVTNQDTEQMNRTLDIIDVITDQSYRRWVTSPPVVDSEIAKLEQAVPSGPVDLSHSLSSAAVAALDSLQMLAALVRENRMILTPARSMMRTALMGAGRIGYVVLPQDSTERETNAATLLALEAGSLRRALNQIETFEHFTKVVPEDYEIEMLREQINVHPSGRMDGDGAMIEKAMRMIGRELDSRSYDEASGAYEEQLTFVWNTASGAAHGFNWQNDFAGIFTADISAVVPAVQYTLEAMRRLWAGSVRDA